MNININKCPPQRAQRRGSALIFVIVSLVLMTILGMAYMQTARMDRIAASVTVESRIDTAVAATTNYVGSVLKADLLDEDDRFFNPADDDGGNGTGFDEPYDYPWTNPAVTFPVEKIDGTGTLGNATGGQHDDTWLASTAPDFSGADPVWPHITNLNGVALRLPSSTGGATPDELYIDNANSEAFGSNRLNDALKRFTGASTYGLDNNTSASHDTLGADADGDGIHDSYWTWAPVGVLGSTRYVMAVRIVDNSSLVNANVALSQVSDAGAYDADAHAPRWSSPSEWDLGRFIYTLSGNSSTVMNSELRDLHLAHRLGTTPPTAMTEWYVDSTTPDVRYYYWLNGPRVYGNYNADASLAGGTSFNRLMIQNELELRHRNGLNNDKFTAPLEDQLPTPLRSAAVETSFSDVAADEQIYFEDDPRHQMTLFSGATIRAPRLPGDPNGALKTDLNYALNLPVADNLGAIPASPAPDASLANLLVVGVENVYGSTGSIPPLPSGYGSTAGQLNAFATQLVTSARDYADTDNQLTRFTDINGDDHWGLEALPFLTEVYAQAQYHVTNVSDEGGGTYNVDWTRQANAGYGIEIRNPFKRPISLENVHLHVGGADWGTLDTLAGQTTLAANEVLIFFRDSDGNGNPGNDDISNLVDTTDAGYTYTIVGLAEDWPGGVTASYSAYSAAPNFSGATVNVELRARDSDGNQLDWPYSKVETVAAPNAYGEQYSSLASSPSNGRKDYWQHAAIGNGNGINILATDFNTFVHKSDWGSNSGDSQLPHVLGGGNSREGIDHLGEANKNVASGAAPAGPPNVIANLNQQVLISDHGRFVQVGELAHMIVQPWEGAGGVYPLTFPEVFSAANISTLMIDPTPAAALIDSGIEALSVPFGTMLLDRLTTAAPHRDGLDNDGDGDVDIADVQQDEVFVPGKVNLNTVPTSLLDLILPVSDATTRGNIITSITDYRDKVGGFAGANRGLGGGFRDHAGIAYPSELVYALSGSLADSADTTAVGGTRIDFQNPASGSDGIIDDREEEVMIGRYLSEIASTRSDIYTAYILIRGYPANDFSKGVVESARLIVVYDRSSVSTNSDNVRILGVYRYP